MVYAVLSVEETLLSSSRCGVPSCASCSRRSLRARDVYLRTLRVRPNKLEVAEAVEVEESCAGSETMGAGTFEGGGGEEQISNR